MSLPHVIRLRGPWECEAVAGAPQPMNVWKRRFGRPTGLESGVQLWLCLRSAHPIHQMNLNQAELDCRTDGVAPHRIDITARIHERNLLEVSLHANDNQGDTGTPFEVWLEIASASTL